MQPKFVTLFLSLIIGRVWIIAINLLSVVVCIACLIEATHLIGFKMSPASISEMEDIFTGLNTMFVALSVFLEERESISVMAKMELTPLQEEINMECHHKGVGMLILTLFSELAIIVIKIPDSIFGISSIQYILFFISFILLALTLIIQLTLVYKLILSYFKN